MDQRVEKIPAHQRVYQQLREMILFGDLAPGQPLTILGLIDRLGVGMTPVREALRRLTAEGALELLGNRRVVVPVLERVEHRDVTVAIMEVPAEHQPANARAAVVAAAAIKSGRRWRSASESRTVASLPQLSVRS